MKSDRAPEHSRITTQQQPSLTRTWVFCRIDYHLATPAIASKAKAEHIYLEQRFSDHAPLLIDYDFDL